LLTADIESHCITTIETGTNGNMQCHPSNPSNNCWHNDAVTYYIKCFAGYIEIKCEIWLKKTWTQCACFKRKPHLPAMA